MPSIDLTPQQWFHEAAQCYIENHQGCPWCHGSHRVYRMTDDERSSYYCQVCDFQATYDAISDKYVCIPGENVIQATCDTMIAMPAFTK